MGGEQGAEWHMFYIISGLLTMSLWALLGGLGHRIGSTPASVTHDSTLLHSTGPRFTTTGRIKCHQPFLLSLPLRLQRSCLSPWTRDLIAVAVFGQSKRCNKSTFAAFVYFTSSESQHTPYRPFAASGGTKQQLLLSVGRCSS